MIVKVACAIALIVVASVVPAAADTTNVTPRATLDCTDPIGGAINPSADDEIFFDQVALMTSRTRDQAMQAAPSGDPASEPFPYFAKTGLLLRTGARSAQLRIPRRERGRLAVSWGNTDHDGIASRVLTVGPCEGGIGFIAFPGGYYVDEPHCARIVVRVGRRERTARIGIGAACPGQRPSPP